jgi:hypothetical protein
MPLSIVFKRELLEYIDFDVFIERGFPVEDYPMQAIMAMHTKWGHIDDLTVVYRVYGESATFISYDHPKYMQYHRGLAETRRYLNELFPADACFTEVMLQEQLFYKEFLLYLYQCNYAAAKQLVTDANSILPNSAKIYQAKRFTRTWLHFVAFHFYKKFINLKELKQRT